MIPFILFFLIVRGIPFLWGMFISTTNFTGYNLSELNFVGLENFKRVFSDSEAMSSIWRTFKIALYNVPLSMVLCLAMSLLLNQLYRSVSIFRTLWYIPAIIPSVATALIWKGIYTQDGGLFNMIRGAFGFDPINWLGYDYVVLSLVVMHLWHCGGGILTNIAAMKQIPDELYEAADIEGAGTFTKVFKITIPMISNMIYMNLLTMMIGALQLFGEPVLLAGVGANGAGLTAIPIMPVYTYLVHVYQQIFVNMRFGYGLAMVWVIFVLIMIITLIMDYFKKKWVYTEADD